MKAFELTVRFPGGGPLIGGASATPYGFHASHAQLPDGKPYIPATALRGALRESLEALLRGTGERACSGGSGMDPEGGVPTRDVESGGDRSCSLGGDGSPCLACRVFGGGRPKIGAAERTFSAIVLGDAVLPSAAGTTSWTTRPSVALQRNRRSAADKHLVFQRIPETGGNEPLSFVASGRISDTTLAPYLEAAVRATTHLGAGRSRGLAHVELTITCADVPDASDTSTVSVDAADSGDLRIRVTLTSPALVGASVIDANYRETRHEIPGATLRGALGFALRELVDDANGDPAVQDLLDRDRGARFGFLYPSNRSPAGTGTACISAPLPITAQWCKREERQHGVVDTLLDRLALLHAATAAAAERATSRSATRCPKCDQPLRTAHGSRLSTAPVDTRTVVRVAMDRARQSARDGQLFSQTLLASGTVLEGTIRGIPPHCRQRLAQALGSGIVSLGRGRSAGWGQVRIDVEPAHRPRSIAERAVAFDRALRARVEAAQITSERIGRLVPVTLLSPLWPSRATLDGADDDGEEDLCAALAPATCFLSARRFIREGAWDQRTGKMDTFRATAAGGIFVLELTQATWRDIVPRLEALERDGIGQRRDQGFGQVLCFDPHFLLDSNNG